MIKICGVVAILLGAYAYSETADLWFAQAGFIGVFLFFSEALFEVLVQTHTSETVHFSGIDDVQSKSGLATI